MGSSQSVDKPKNRILFKDGLLSPTATFLPQTKKKAFK